jgi:hypothetical protein
MSELLGFAAPGAGPPRSYEQVLADFPEMARRSLPVDMAELASEIAREVEIIEPV